MPARLVRGVFLFVIVSGLAAGTSAAGQTDVALSAYWTFSTATTGNQTTQTPDRTAGFLVELRHTSHPLIGYEATYSFNHDDQSYVATVSPPATAVISADAHEITGDWVISARSGDVRPFAVAGIGVLMDVPTAAMYYPCGVSLQLPCGVESKPPTNTSIQPVFVYGGGLDLPLAPYIGLRIQYRGNLAKAAEMTSRIHSSGALTHTAEPTFGAYFHF